MSRSMYSDGAESLALMAALSIASLGASRTRRAEPIRTREQVAIADKRTERQRWNDEVEATKQAKLAAKGKE